MHIYFIHETHMDCTAVCHQAIEVMLWQCPAGCLSPLRPAKSSSCGACSLRRRQRPPHRTRYSLRLHGLFSLVLHPPVFSGSPNSPGTILEVWVRQQSIIATHLAANPDGYAIIGPGLGDVAASGAVVWIRDRHGTHQSSV